MKTLLTVEELIKRAGETSLPLDTDGNIDNERLETALKDASGIIVAHLPWLLEDEEIIEPIPMQFDSAIKGICSDISLNRLTDTVSSSEDQRALYAQSIKLLEKIDREYKGGLSGPDNQEASVVVAGGSDDDKDPRFWKKGKIL